jgi:hypothetical protein
VRPDSGYNVVPSNGTQNYAVKGDHLFTFDDVKSLKEKVFNFTGDFLIYFFTSSWIGSTRLVAERIFITHGQTIITMNAAADGCLSFGQSLI